MIIIAIGLPAHAGHCFPFVGGGSPGAIMEPASPSAALIELTLTPATDSDRERLENGLRVLTAEDPTLRVTRPRLGYDAVRSLRASR
jgi:translation elongation factor EF-G